MLKTSLGVFFFGLLGLCLAVTGLGAWGFKAAPLSGSFDQIVPVILGLSAVCVLLGLLIHHSGKTPHRK